MTKKTVYMLVAVVLVLAAAAEIAGVHMHAASWWPLPFGYDIFFGYSLAGIGVSFGMRHFYKCGLDYRYIALDMCCIYHYCIARHEWYLKTCIILFVYVLCTPILFPFLGR